MIRDDKRIYAEVNDPNTVLASGTLETGVPVVGNGNKAVKSFTGKSSILFLDDVGQLSVLPTNVKDKYVGTDNNGQLTLLDIDTVRYRRIYLGGTTILGEELILSESLQPGEILQFIYNDGQTANDAVTQVTVGTDKARLSYSYLSGDNPVQIKYLYCEVSGVLAQSSRLIITKLSNITLNLPAGGAVTSEISSSSVALNLKEIRKVVG